MKIDLSLNEAYARASEGLRQKMEYSIRLLQKAERLALAYDSRGENENLYLCRFLYGNKADGKRFQEQNV